MGGHEPQPLPEVVFKVIDDPNILLPVGVADKQAVAFGFNSGEWAGKEGKDGQEVEGRYQRWLRKSFLSAPTPGLRAIRAKVPPVLWARLGWGVAGRGRYGSTGTAAVLKRVRYVYFTREVAREFAAGMLSANRCLYIKADSRHLYLRTNGVGSRKTG